MNPEIQAHFEKKEIRGRERLVAVIPMTKEQARLAYPYRPHSKYAESSFGGDACYDDMALLMIARAFRCRMCQAPTWTDMLIDGACPDCDGRAERREA